MPATTYKLRLDTEQLEKWQKSADEDGLKLAEWIRRRCDAGKAVQPDRDVPVARGSTSAPERPAKPKSPKYEPGSIAVSVADRTKHELGCECFQCIQAERFFRSQREK